MRWREGARWGTVDERSQRIEDIERARYGTKIGQLEEECPEEITGWVV